MSSARLTPPPLPSGLSPTEPNEIANRLHTVAIHLLRRAAAGDRALGLTAERLSMLSVLTFGGPMPIHRAAAIEGVSVAAASRSIGGLEELGLASRSRGTADDKRLVLAAATPAGRQLMERGRRQRLGVLAELLDGLSTAERATVTKALAPLERALGRPSG